MASSKEPLSVTHPELAAQADGWDASTVTAGSDKRRAWKCHDGHTWKAVVGSRARGSGCPVCANQLVMVGVNDLATLDPELAAEAHGWNPNTLSQWSNRKMTWQCKHGHIWKTQVATRSKGNGCPICSGQIVLAGFNDLQTTNPQLAAEANNWDPTTLANKSGKKVGWKCSLGHEWNATVAHRSNGTGCPVCASREILIGFNDLATKNPELAAEAFGWDPTTTTASSNRLKSWKCRLGHIWNSSIGNRTAGKGCPFCANQILLVGFNDLATKNPELAAEAFGWDPTSVISGTNKKRLWQCHLAHVWSATVASRVIGSGCPICSGRTVLPGFNDLWTINPILAAEADGWDATTVTPISGQKRRWKCLEGHTWTTQVSNRANGRGCPTCAKFGFDPNQTGWLYLIENDELDMFEIGISNFPESRIGQHSKRGWEVIEVRGPMEGHLAQQLETAILHAVERRGAVLGHKADIEKFDGYSEAWTKASLPVAGFKQLLDWVYEDDEALTLLDLSEEDVL
jgi:hypothetical protein